MALMYEDKTYGYRVQYRVYAIDNTFIDKSRSFKSKAFAKKTLQEVELLEKLSSEKKLTAREIAYYIFKKFVTAFEARSLTRERVFPTRPYELSLDESGRMI